KCRSLTRTSTLRRLGHRIVNGYYFHPIHRRTRHIESKSHVVNILHVGCTLNRSTHCVTVVLTNKNNGQFPKHRHIQGFVESALSNRSVSHITNIHVIGSQIFFRKCDTSTQRDLSPYDTVSAHKLMLF